MAPSSSPSSSPSLSAAPTTKPSDSPSVSLRPSSEPTDYVSAICQNVDLQLDSSGRVSVEASDVNNGSKGGIATLELNQTSFNCANIGDNTVTLTATDVNTNVDSCQALISISDTIVPDAICQDATITLDTEGKSIVSVQNVRVSI